MIAYISGKIISKTENTVVIQAGNIGYEINITCHTSSNLPSNGEEVSLFIAETASMYSTQVLYGFESEEEKTLFEMLKSIPKLGPKKALECLDKLSLIHI